MTDLSAKEVQKKLREELDELGELHDVLWDAHVDANTVMKEKLVAAREVLKAASEVWDDAQINFKDAVENAESVANDSWDKSEASSAEWDTKNQKLKALEAAEKDTAYNKNLNKGDDND